MTDKTECIDAIKSNLRTTATWRKTKLAIRFPNDERNMVAADLLKRLIEDADNMTDADWQQLQPHYGFTEEWMEANSEASRLVGFKFKSAEIGPYVRNLVGLLN